MLIVHHRINHVTHLTGIPADDGVEIDLRRSGANVILNHEPFETRDRLEDDLDAYGRDRKAPLSLNVKEGLLKKPVIAFCQNRRIENLFLLDCAFPTLVRLANEGFAKLALRISEYEPSGIRSASDDNGRRLTFVVDQKPRSPQGRHSLTFRWSEKRLAGQLAETVRWWEERVRGL